MRPFMHKRQKRLRATWPHWVRNEIEMAVADMPWTGVAWLGCLAWIGVELSRPDPCWETIQCVIRAAQRAFPRRFGLNYRRLEARLTHLFTERRREQLCTIRRAAGRKRELNVA